MTSGDVTLGFHESRHQVDYLAFLKNNALPSHPDLKIGMTVAEYTRERNRFLNAFRDYKRLMDEDSDAKTDEVGHKKSTRVSTRKCFKHNP